MQITVLELKIKMNENIMISSVCSSHVFLDVFHLNLSCSLSFYFTFYILNSLIFHQLYRFWHYPANVFPLILFFTLVSLFIFFISSALLLHLLFHCFSLLNSCRLLIFFSLLLFSFTFDSYHYIFSALILQIVSLL
jgi:hypothetical protein